MPAPAAVPSHELAGPSGLTPWPYPAPAPVPSHELAGPSGLTPWPYPAPQLS